MTDVLKELLTSKKALVTLAGLILAGVGHLGLNLNPDFVNAEVALIAAYVVGQGITDHGKSAAQVQAAASLQLAALVPPPPAPARVAQGGFIDGRMSAFLAMFAVAAIAAAGLAQGCGGPQIAAEKTAGTCVETAAIKAIESDITTAVTEGADGWESVALAALTSVAPDAVVCVAQLVENLIKSKLGASPNGADAAAAARAHQLVDDLQSHRRWPPSAKTTMLEGSPADFIGGTIP